MKRALVTATLLAATLAVPSGAAAPPAPRTPGAEGAEGAEGVGSPAAARAARAEWARRYRAYARDLPVTPLLDAADAAAASESYDYAALVPAGDLDGDRIGDVADLRLHQTYDDDTGRTVSTLRVEARRGQDGRALWSTSIGGDESFPYVLFTRVGAAGRPGMLAIVGTYEVVDAELGGAVHGGVTVTGYDGAGKQVWTHETDNVAGGAVAAAAGVSAFADDVGDLVPGGGLDLLLDVTTWAEAADPFGAVYEGRGRAQLQVLDGATGTVRDLGQAHLVDSSWVWPSVVGDVNGDKRDDVALLDYVTDAPSLRLLRSSDGAEHWVAALPRSEDFEVDGVPDVTGDRVADVLVFAQVEDAAMLVVDGARGKVVTRRDGGMVHVVGDVDRRPGSDFVTGERLDESRGVGFTLTAFTAANRRLWTTTRALKGHNGPSLHNVTVTPAGDVQGDGVTDFVYALEVLPMGAVGRREAGLVDGRTSRVRTLKVTGLQPAGGALDGRGADLLTRTDANGVLTLAAYRGDSAARLWQTSLTVAKGTFWSYAAGTDRDRCDDLVVTVAAHPTTTSYVISGATGVPAWALTRRGDGASVVSRPKARATKRFTRTC